MNRQSRKTVASFKVHNKVTVGVKALQDKQAVPALPNDELFSVPQSDSVDSVLSELVNTVIG
jgi:ribosomal protein L5